MRSTKGETHCVLIADLLNALNTASISLWRTRIPSFGSIGVSMRAATIGKDEQDDRFTGNCSLGITL